jgi:hypothetical protein
MNILNNSSKHKACFGRVMKVQLQTDASQQKQATGPQKTTETAKQHAKKDLNMLKRKNIQENTKITAATAEHS